MSRARASAMLGGLLLAASLLAWADTMPNGKDVLVREHALNMPVGRILLAHRGKGYCALQFTASTWSADESSATYAAHYIPDAATRFADVKPEKNAVHQKEPLPIIGRFAMSRTEDGIFCGKITLRGNGGPNGTAWVYFDEEKTLQLAPTKWRDIRDVNLSDPALKWFRYGDVTEQLLRLE